MGWQRIRTIKPAFFQNEMLASLPALARLLFIGLWTVADREGRLEDRPRRLKAQILPYDEADLEALLSGLSQAGFIRRYSYEGTDYIEIANFLRHQRPHPRESASEIPPAPPRPALGKPRLVLGQSKDPQEEIQEENQEETLPRIASGKPRRATRWPADFTLTDGRMGLGKDLGVEMPWEWNHFKDHHQAKGSRFLDWDAAWRTWLRNAVDFQERRARR